MLTGPDEDSCNRDLTQAGLTALRLRAQPDRTAHALADAPGFVRFSAQPALQRVADEPRPDPPDASAPRSWSTRLRACLRLGRAADGFIADDQGLLIATAGGLGREAHEEIAARFSATISQLQRLPAPADPLSGVVGRWGADAWTAVPFEGELRGFLCFSSTHSARDVPWTELLRELQGT